MITLKGEYTSKPTVIDRYGSVNNYIGINEGTIPAPGEGAETGSISVLGGTGGSAALAVGDISIDDVKAKANLLGYIIDASADMTLNGDVTTAIHGNVNTWVDKMPTWWAG